MLQFVNLYLSTNLKRTTIGRNFIAKLEKFFNTMQKIPLEISLPLSRNCQKTEMISHGYDVNDHVYSKSKSI